MPHSLQVSDTSSRSGRANPIYIWGPSGSGKSYLADQIVKDSLVAAPELRIRRATTEQVEVEFIEALHNDQLSEFRDGWNSADIIVLEELDRFEGKESIQEELGRSLIMCPVSRGHQVIITSSLPLDRLKGLQQRLGDCRDGRIVHLPRPSLPVRFSWAETLAQGRLTHSELVEAAREGGNFHSVRGEVITRLARNAVIHHVGH